MKFADFPELGTEVEFLQKRELEGDFDYDIGKGIVAGAGINNYGHACVQVKQDDKYTTVELKKLDTSEENKIALIDIDMRAYGVLKEAQPEIQRLSNERDEMNAKIREGIEQTTKEVEELFKKREEEHNALYHDFYGVNEL